MKNANVIKVPIENLVVNAECMRDLAGSFYKRTSNNNVRCRNIKLIYSIPDATKRAVEKDSNFFGCDSVNEAYKEMLTDGFKALMEHPRTKDAIEDFINGTRSVNDFTDDEIAGICDVYYVDSVPAAVELVAIELMRDIKW